MMNSVKRKAPELSLRTASVRGVGRGYAPALCCLLVSFLGLVSGCGTIRGSGEGESPDLTHLRTAPEDWDRVFNANDPVKLAALYADEAILMAQNSTTLRGRSAIQADFARYFAEYAARQETFVDEILTHQDWAIERGRFTLVSTPKPSGPEAKSSGRHVICRRKINGVWLIAWEIWNSEREPAR